MEFKILGPLAVVADGDRPIDLGSRRQRLLLAVLVCRARELVSVDALVDAVWGATPPESAVDNVYLYISRLRRALGAHRITGRAGYTLCCDADELDAARFSSIAQVGRSDLAAGNPRSAADQLREALSLWRGDPFAGLDSVVLAAESARLLDQRLLALEDRIEADLALGNHRILVGELLALTGKYPYRERFHAALMLALFRSGRRADALGAYQVARTTLLNDLGLEPASHLRRLHQAILRSDPGLLQAGIQSWPAPVDASPRMDVRPRQLPPHVSGFVGRVDELTQLEQLRAEPDAAARIIAITGAAGVGKTALACRWAHQIADRFPDGQLFLDMRGFGRGQPVQPLDALGRFLRALGAKPETVPDSEEDAAALYRTTVAGKRVLVFLDNAASPAQVRPLIPADAGSLVVVTSRDRLTGLVSFEGAGRLDLCGLGLQDSCDVLRRVLGPARVDVEATTAIALAEACDQLPLALRIAAANLVDSPQRPLRDYLDALTGKQALDMLEIAGEEDRAVRHTFGYSYRRLPADAQRMFRLQGLVPGADIGIDGAAALAGVPAGAAASQLRQLAAIHLVVEHPTGRYTVHDLLRAYAAELVEAQDSCRERIHAHRRLLDFLVHSAHRAALLVMPLRDPISLDRPQPEVTAAQLDTYDQAVAWFAAEQQALIVAQQRAEELGMDRHVWRLAWTVQTVLDRQGAWDQLLTIQARSVAAADRLGDAEAVGRAHRNIAHIYRRRGQYDQALNHFRSALEVAVRAEDHLAHGRVLIERCAVLERQGAHRQAVQDAQDALMRLQAIGHLSGQAHAHNTIGWSQVSLGEYQQAMTHCQHAIGLHQQIGNREGEAAAWDSLGAAHHHLGNHATALECYHHSLLLYREHEDRANEAEVLTHLGDSHAAAGDPAQAEQAWREALGILTELNDPDASKVRTRLAAKRSR